MTYVDVKIQYILDKTSPQLHDYLMVFIIYKKFAANIREYNVFRFFFKILHIATRRGNNEN